MLSECKEACEFLANVKKEKHFQLILQKWSVLEEVTGVLKLAFVTTKILQSGSFTLSDFFGCWLKMKFKLKRVIENGESTTNFASTFLEKILIREKELLRYPTMLCAIYLDRRYKKELKNAEHIAIAKYTLANLYERVLSNRQQSQPSNDSELDSFEIYLRQGDSSINATTEIYSNIFDRADFMKKLEEFDEKSVHINHKSDILRDWNERKADHPELYELACIIYGIPPTQVTVERSFSAMAFVFNPKRAKLGQQMLEDILMIKLNSEVVPSINERDLKALEI